MLYLYFLKKQCVDGLWLFFDLLVFVFLYYFYLLIS